MKDLEKIAKKIKELNAKYENINSIEFEEFEKEMTKIMENLSLKELLEIEEKFLTK